MHLTGIVIRLVESMKLMKGSLYPRMVELLGQKDADHLLRIGERCWWFVRRERCVRDTVEGGRPQETL